MLTGWNEIRKAQTDGQADRQVDRRVQWDSRGAVMVSHQLALLMDSDNLPPSSANCCILRRWGVCLFDPVSRCDLCKTTRLKPLKLYGNARC